MELDDLVTRFSSMKENQRKAIMLMFHKKQKPDSNKRIGRKIMYKISRADMFKCLFFAVISAIISTPLQLFNSIVIEGITGPPSFVTIPFLVYAISMKFFFAIGYILIGYRFPIKSTRLRAYIYMLLILLSSYLPNILAMAGGDGEIIKSSFSVSIVILDCISYTLDGLLLGKH